LGNKKIHGYYLLTEDRSIKISRKYNVDIKGCFGENIIPSIEAPIMFRNSFTLEKLMSCNDPQIKYYEITNDGQLLSYYQNFSPAEIGANVIRNRIHQGTLQYAKDAVEIRKYIYPEFKPSTLVTENIMGIFLENLCQNEKNLLSTIILDDYYCGRDLVY